MTEEQRNNLEAELRCLHSSLDASSSEFGDWNMCKCLEGFFSAMAGATNDDCVEKLLAWINETSETLQSKIGQRTAARARINEIEAELEE